MVKVIRPRKAFWRRIVNIRQKFTLLRRLERYSILLACRRQGGFNCGRRFNRQSMVNGLINTNSISASAAEDILRQYLCEIEAIIMDNNEQFFQLILEIDLTRVVWRANEISLRMENLINRLHLQQN